MDFNRTSTKRRGGFTLVEMVVALGISSLLMVGLAALMFYTGRSFAAMLNYVELDQASRNALDTMSREIRQANRLLEGDSHRLLFEDSDGGRLEYFYSRSARTLTRTKGSASKVLLKQCDELTFTIYQRNPIEGTYNVYPTATPGTTKLVQLRWTCSRDLIRSRVNTESVQSSKIVIRKQ